MKGILSVFTLQFSHLLNMKINPTLWRKANILHFKMLTKQFLFFLFCSPFAFKVEPLSHCNNILQLLPVLLSSRN